MKLCCAISKPAEGAEANSHTPPLQCCRCDRDTKQAAIKNYTDTGGQRCKGEILFATNKAARPLGERLLFYNKQSNINHICNLSYNSFKKNGKNKQLKLRSDFTFCNRLIEIAI